MHNSAAVDLHDAELADAWHLTRLRRIGRIYAGICGTCTVFEYYVGIEALALIYLVNTWWILLLTGLLNGRNTTLVERVAIATVTVTCLASVLISESLMNISYLVTLLCAVSIHERNARWRRIWLLGYVTAFAWITVHFAYHPPAASGAGDFYHGLIAFACSVAVLAFLLSEYVDANREVYAGHARLNDELLERVEVERQTGLELQEQLAARQRVTRSIEQSIASAHFTRGRLEANNEQLEQFAYAASHDLKEPVRTIRSFMQMVRRKLPAEAAADASLAEHFDYIESNAHAMHNVLERLLLYSRASRVEACAKTCAVQRVWLTALLKSTVEPELRQAHVAALSVGDTVLVHADPQKLQAVFAELLDNAVRFVAPGQEPSFAIEVDPPRDGRVTTRLTDRGIGIDGEYLEQVFGLFRRLHPREQYPSAGVGLALVARLLEQIGGTIAIRSAAGEGTTVEVMLPAGPGGG